MMKTIQSKLISLFLFLSLTPLIVVATYAYFEGQEALRNGIGMNFEALALNAMDKVDRSLWSRKQDLKAWASIEAMQDVIADDADGRIVDILVQLKKEYGMYSEIFVATTKGEIVAANSPVLMGADVSQTHWFRETMKNRRVFISDLRFDDTTEEYAVSMSIPLEAAYDKSEVIGILSSRINRAVIFEMTSDTHLFQKYQDRSRHVVLINKKGEAISKQDGRPGHDHVDAGDHLHYQDNLIALGLQSVLFAMDGRHGFLEEKGVFGSDQLVGYAGSTGYRDFEGLGWSTLVLQDTQSAFAPIMTLRFQVIGASILLVTLVLILVWHNARGIITPIKRLTSATARVAEGDLSQYVAIETRDELQTLADAFNQMVKDIKESRARLVDKQYVDSIIANMIDALIVIDAFGEIKTINRAALNLVGYDQNELIGGPASLLFSEAECLNPEGIEEMIRGALLRDQEMAFKTKSGLVIPVSISCSILNRSESQDKEGKPFKSEIDRLRIVMIGRDLTERKEAEDALREKEERYALAVQGANDGIWDWDLNAGRVYFSPRWKAMVGASEDEVGNAPSDWFSRLDPEDIAQVKEKISQHLNGMSPHFECEHRIKHQDGGYRWMLSRGLAIQDAAGKNSRMAGSMTDITERKVAEMQLLHGALHDSLTNLANRALFIDHLNRAIIRIKRHKEYLFAVLFLDLDRFKVINDSLGHMVGDQLLIDVARRLEKCLRQDDTIARLGGDEFSIFLDDIENAEKSAEVAARIQNDLSRPFEIMGREVYITVSIGITIGKDSYENPEDLLRDSDNAMYRAKGAGRARHEIFTKTMYEHAMDRLKLETDLRRAVDREEFFLEYQPIVSLHSGRASGCEALMRWRHPERGLISPQQFIPLAEETGLIVPMGEWLIRTACEAYMSWSEAGHCLDHISVNCAARQFQQGQLVHTISAVLREKQMPGSAFRMEITESSAMQNIQLTTMTLRELSAMGISLSIDDFGTGYSSLSYLKHFPINTVKIDRSFIKEISDDMDSAAIIVAIIAMAHSLKLDVIAEGVETEAQLTFLRQNDCDAIQGYYISQPVSADAFLSFLKKTAALKTLSAEVK
ncbi:MAG: EAL domain-containing protein [Nitrospiria bacterium]